MITVSNSSPLALKSVMILTGVIASSGEVTKRASSSSRMACQSSMSPPAACVRGGRAVLHGAEVHRLVDRGRPAEREPRAAHAVG